jgi:lipopolysaccharide transport system ATP-binding protein
VGSLLEVGTGFHPELTGRENIYLNGAILGMRRREIAQQFDAIVEFAGAGKFLDTPVKRYSSGMYVRLAFAVAAHLEPEILIVDEVLAVGDAEFQRRCLGKMEDVARQGRTVLFVSHNMAAVNRMCRQGLLLKGGRVHRAGPVEAVVSEYLSSGGDAEGEREWSEPAEAPGNGGPMRLRAVRVLDAEGEPCANLDIRRSLTVEIHYEVLEALPRVRVAFRLVAGDGSVAFTSSDSNDAAWRDRTRGPGTYVSRCRIPGDFLNEGRYSLTVSADVPLVQVLFLEENALAFRVEQTGGVSGGLPERWPGAVCPLLPWEIQTTEPEVAQRPSEPNTHGPKLLARK